MKNLSLTWNLDSIYEGGSNSQTFAAELAGLEQDINKLGASLADKESAQSLQERLTSWTDLVQSIMLRLQESGSFVSCLQAQDMKDTKASLLNDRLKTISASFQGVLTRFDEQLRETPDAEWEAWLSQEEIKPVAFNLNERRELAKDKLPPEQEALISELSVDGYHGWSDLYDTVVGRAKFRAQDENGNEQLLSAGQMHNRLSDGDRAVREAAFDEWEREWGEQAELCGEGLNRIAGFRLKLYGKRGWESVLKEPLQINRMSEATLNAMWSAVEAGKAELTKYLQRKAKLMGLEKLDWHDVDAPLGATAKIVPYDEAAAFIVERFRAFNPDLAEFSEKAFREGWIEVEDRSGKRPGGFCTSFPKSRQTRIFMTYSGTASNIATLAHELGHAYHQYLMDDLPPLAQDYAMNVAETASTFAEMIVADSALQMATEPQEKLAMLEDKLGRSVAFFMDIHARFVFETGFYEKRRSGMLSVEELSTLMEDAQAKAFGDILGRKHPEFWASKLHFYLTGVPFYNFPYTFGFLFSSGIYARALAEGQGFAQRYVDLLRDTGRMNVEDLAYKHLGVKLDDTSFWSEAVKLCIADVQTFLDLTE
ncbi:M3 family oligoendopeptidase [Paenibacillus pinihumi]|uniref:M3 family oligoendopeptidase n=1 Tax=Paenibacillus pinihumi TaxID=669462 RepID=UPI0004184DD3|nr:M3 family oligoendopeptidase [Paenibacillus pinihumi]